MHLAFQRCQLMPLRPRTPAGSAGRPKVLAIAWHVYYGMVNENSLFMYIKSVLGEHVTQPKNNILLVELLLDLGMFAKTATPVR